MPGKPFYSPIDLNGNEIQNWALQYVSGARTGLKIGFVWYSVTIGPVYYDGTSTRPLDAKYLTDGSIPIAGLATNPLSRDNHTGTQVAATIRDLKAVVTQYRHDEFQAPTSATPWGSQKITGLGAGTNLTDAVNLGQVQTLISQSISGQKAIKNPVRGVFATNITLSGVQNTDGVTGSTTDTVNRWLVSAQTDPKQNGIYQMSSGAWTRAVDADEPSEWTEGTELLVLSGALYGGTIWRQTAPGGSNGVVTPGTDTMNFTLTTKINTYTADNTTITLTGMQFALKVSLAGGLTTDANGVKVDPTYVARKFTGSITGNGSTQTFTITHNANNNRPFVQFFTTAGVPVDIEWAPVDLNNIQVTFGANSIPAVGSNFTASIYA